MTRNRSNLVGQTFGLLRVVSATGASRDGRILWDCVCRCGRQKAVATSHLRRGHVKSCGCLRTECQTNRKHGYHGTPTYVSWQGMKQRCRGQGKDGASYVAKGITYCHEWESFDRFLADMGERPEGKTLDRIDNSSGYSKSNCRWATPREQNQNRDSTRIFEWNGGRYAMVALAEICGVPAQTFARRLERGWSLDKAMSTPPDSRMGKKRKEKT
jgi:hypothetical protein